MLIAVLASLAVLEAGWSGDPYPARMATAYPRLDGPIAADHSGSVVVDVPFGLRGGIPLSGKPVNPRALLLATADEHPRAITYLSWNPPPTTAATSGTRRRPAGGRPASPPQLAAATGGGAAGRPGPAHRLGDRVA